MSGSCQVILVHLSGQQPPAVPLARKVNDICGKIGAKLVLRHYPATVELDTVLHCILLSRTGKHGETFLW